MKVFISLVAVAAIVTQVFAADPLKFRGSGLFCYDNDWSVNGKAPSVLETTVEFCKQYDGTNITELGYLPAKTAEFKTPEGKPFKLVMHMWPHVPSVRIWDVNLCIKLFEDVIKGCDTLKGYDIGHFQGGSAHTLPRVWSATIECEIQSCKEAWESKN